MVRNMFKVMVLALAVIFAAPIPSVLAQTAEQDAAIHDDIRAMRDRAIAAFAARDADALLVELSENVYFTAMNNEAVHGKPALRDYYARMLNGADGLVQDMSVEFESDVLSALYDDGTAAVATGTADAAFKMRAGLEFKLPLRWTAALVKEGGAWKIAGMHFSANIFDNPLDTGLRKYLWLMLGGAGILGLIIGVLIGRRRRA